MRNQLLEMDFSNFVWFVCVFVAQLISTPASFSQKQLWLDQQQRSYSSKPDDVIHNISFVYPPSFQQTISVEKLCHALQLVINKHLTLHTALVFDTTKNILIQRVMSQQHNKNTLFSLTESIFDTDEQLNNILDDEQYNSHLFDLSQGLVFRCHLVYYKEIPSNQILTDKDVLIFSFHHASFDLPSMNIFLHDLNQAYTTGQLPNDDDTTLRYLDYAIIEQQMPMTAASMFWLDTLHDCDLDRSLPLPYDRYRLRDEQRTTRVTSVCFDFGQDLSQHFLTYASSHNTSLQHLMLANYYAFIFKLTNGERDLCVSQNINNRYRDELKLVIGLFENTVPLRCQLDPQWSFHQLMKNVCEMETDSMKYSYFPLQRILNQHPNVSQAALLNICFAFSLNESENIKNEVMIGDVLLHSMFDSINRHQHKMMKKFDFSLMIELNMTTNQLSCTINASLDLFNVETVDKIAQRFHSMFHRLSIMTDHQEHKPICQLSLTLTNERLLVQSMNNTQTSFLSVTCIHHEFVHQALKYPQKLAVELDDQSLTYTELLHCVQALSITLMTTYGVVPGEIICQCVERSLSMVIGIMAIEMVGGVYCPLSPRDPTHRLHALIQQTQSRLVLVHHTTKTRFDRSIILVDIGLVLTMRDKEGSVDVDRLLDVIVKPNDIAYIIFTSGSTGTPKVVQVRHGNFTDCVRSLVYRDTFNKKDVMAQMTRCSFDIHVQEILGALMIGATLVMLHPGGLIDFDYLSGVLHKKQITYMHSVPSLLHSLFTFVEQYKDRNVLKHLRSLCSSGEPFSAKLLGLMRNGSIPNYAVWNLYGPAETTIDCTAHLVDVFAHADNIPIGFPLPNYRCIVIDEDLQPSLVGREGELCVGGVGVFAGYLGRDDLTVQALVEIDSERFYRTGDLARVDNNGLIHYIGRKDYQIKLHGQRIELGEIERCLLNTSISACVVIKYSDDHLAAYVQSSDISEVQLREHCRSHLPSHMVPSIFIILDKLPLNANGKVDRKLLPAPQFLTVNKTDFTDSLLLTPLEEKLRLVFSQAFHYESPDVFMSFGQMGGTSLDAIRALWLIRQDICSSIDAGLLFANPSIQQLAEAIEPLLTTQDKMSMTSTTLQLVEDHDRPIPCLHIEIIGIMLLIFQWILPIWSAYQFQSFLALLFVPVLHLLSYLICHRVLFRSKELVSRTDKLYSWHYYRWWFLNTIWSINNSYWLKHLVGTPFYNSYLRLCGAKIGRHTHIYTTVIDTPWLMEVGEFTFIGDEVVLSSLSYHDRTYELHRIQIGSHCCINTRSVLYEGVKMEDHVYVGPMSAITGPISASNNDIFMKDQLFSIKQLLYQFGCLLYLFCVHGILILLAYTIYSRCLTLLLPLSVCFAFTWLMWTLINLLVALVSLKFIVGPVTSNQYSFNSYYYLRKLWLRQLILTSFHHSIDTVPSYDVLPSIILRWLGAHIEDDVRFAEFRQILGFPSNLLHIKSGVTTFGGAKLASFELTKGGLCSLDKIHLDSGTNLTNWCTIMPGTRLSPQTMVGSLTLFTRETISDNVNGVLLGIPAREMPFSMSDNTASVENDLSSSNSVSMHTLLFTCLSFFISKWLFIALYSSLPAGPVALFHVILACLVYHYSISFSKTRTQSVYSKLIAYLQQILHQLLSDYFIFVGPYLSGTQFLVFLFRGLGAEIGSDVILPNISCLTDPHLTTIGDHVRLHTGAYVQCHTFERRLLKLAPVTVNHSSVLMSNSLVLPGSVLQGENLILPWTLVMKNDQLPSNTNWSGVPAQRIL